jgi:hypothetical protein
MSDEHSHFVRQRRNLILISLLMLFYKVADLKLTQIDILGNHATIGNPSIVTFALGIVFFYYLWRYYTACKESFGIRQVRDAYFERIEKICKPLVFDNVKLNHSGVSISEISPQEKFWSRFTYRVKLMPRGEPMSKHDFTVNLIPIYMMRAIGYVILHRSVFTEYIFPYILAALALLEFCNIKIIESFAQFTYDVHSFIATYIHSLYIP